MIDVSRNISWFYCTEISILRLLSYLYYNYEIECHYKDVLMSKCREAYRFIILGMINRHSTKIEFKTWKSLMADIAKCYYPLSPNRLHQMANRVGKDCRFGEHAIVYRPYTFLRQIEELFLEYTGHEKKNLPHDPHYIPDIPKEYVDGSEWLVQVVCDNVFDGPGYREVKVDYVKGWQLLSMSLKTRRELLSRMVTNMNEVAKSKGWKPVAFNMRKDGKTIIIKNVISNITDKAGKVKNTTLKNWAFIIRDVVIEYLHKQGIPESSVNRLGTKGHAKAVHYDVAFNWDITR